jgi:lipid II:glycine glycyltransferase (peptidoglycan interpeptide bridge formation enzyme)
MKGAKLNQQWRHVISTRNLSREEWDSLVLSFRDVSYRCGSYSEAAAQDIGAKTDFIGFYRGEHLVGLASVRVKTLLMDGLGIAYVSGGPLTFRGDGFSIDGFSPCIDALKEEYVVKRKLVLRMVPPNATEMRLARQTDMLQARGFRPLRPNKQKTTIILDLRRSLPDIRKTFHGKWRGHLSKAERSNIRISRSTLVSDFDQFEPLFERLAQAKEFSVRQDVSFFRRVQEDAPVGQKLAMHLAWQNNELIAGHLGSFLGDAAVFLLGAANAKGRKLRASHLLQWAVIKYAQSVGCRSYDLGGINWKENAGVYHFKDRMRGRHFREVQYEVAPTPFKASVFHLIEDAYNTYRNISDNFGGCPR